MWPPLLSCEVNQSRPGHILPNCLTTSTTWVLYNSPSCLLQGYFQRNSNGDINKYRVVPSDWPAAAVELWIVLWPRPICIILVVKKYARFYFLRLDSDNWFELLFRRWMSKCFCSRENLSLCTLVTFCSRISSKCLKMVIVLNFFKYKKKTPFKRCH